MNLIIVIALLLLAVIVVGASFSVGMMVGSSRASTPTQTLTDRERKILAELVDAASASRDESDRALADAGFDIEGASRTELARLRDHLR